jgi:hypothetical protein
MRWFVIDEYIRVHSITEPIVSIDWDSLVFENLETHFRKLSVTDEDIGDTIDKETPIPDHRTAPYWVGNLSAIRFLTALLEAHVKCKTPVFLSAKRNGDMAWWQRVREAGCYNTPIDLSMEIDGALFDHNATCELDDYESDSGGKKLFWLDGKPHFKRRSDGGLVKSVAIHCFWVWKEKTSDILHKATSGYSGE